MFLKLTLIYYDLATYHGKTMYALTTTDVRKRGVNSTLRKNKHFFKFKYYFPLWHSLYDPSHILDFFLVLHPVKTYSEMIKQG